MKIKNTFCGRNHRFCNVKTQSSVAYKRFGGGQEHLTAC